jgi:hypothetical protein
LSENPCGGPEAKSSETPVRENLKLPGKRESLNNIHVQYTGTETISIEKCGSVVKAYGQVLVNTTVLEAHFVKSDGAMFFATNRKQLGGRDVREAERSKGQNQIGSAVKMFGLT